jgi:hypothetical protein
MRRWSDDGGGGGTLYGFISPGPAPGGGRPPIDRGSSAAVEKKLTAAINLGFGSRGGEEADGGD